MAQNSDLIEIVATAADSGCGCSASDFAGDFIAKTNGSYITSLSSPGNESVWTPYVFTLGDDAAGQTATLKVQADTNANAEIIVEGNSTCSIKPNVIQCSQFKSGNSNINITSTSAALPALTLSGNLLADTDSSYTLGTNGVRWSNVFADAINVSGTATIGTLSLANLTLTGNLEVDGTTQLDGNVTVGNASTDTLTVNAATSFANSFSVPNASGTITTGNNLLSMEGRIQNSSSSVSTFNKLTVSDALVASQAPSTNTEVVRRTDVNIGTSTSFGPALSKITVAGGYITAATNGIVASDLPVHASRHATSTRIANTPTTGGDGIEAYEVGAVERVSPVVGKPLKIINGASASNYNYTGGVAQDYFVLIEANAGEPSNSGIPGQIIFRKAT